MTPTTPPTPTRRPVKGFDARRATATLLLLTGSVSAGLTTLWLGGRAQPTAASTDTTTQDAAQSTDDQYTNDQYTGDQYTDGQYTDDQYTGNTYASESYTNGGYGAQGDWAQAAPQGSAYAAQPQGRTRATTRGS